MIELGVAYILDLAGYAVEKGAKIGDRSASATPPTSKPVDILREKLAGGTASEIKDVLKRVKEDGVSLSDLFTQDSSMLPVLGSRLARTQNRRELQESLSALGEDLSQILRIRNAKGNTLVSETVFFAEHLKSSPSQLKSILTELKKLGADMQGAENKLQDDSHTANAIKGIISAVRKGAGWLKQNDE